MKTSLCLILVLAALLTPVYAVEPPVINAKGAILYEVKSGEVLFEQNADAQLYPASTTKLMTALVALENGDPNDKVTVSSNAVKGLPERGSNVFLIAGEEMVFSDLIEYLIIASGNDAANALAEHVAGSQDAFAQMMNVKAQALGCTGTHFANPHGLHDDNHYTTARDMLLIAEAALQNPTIAEVVAMPQATLAATNKHPSETTVTTTNHLISRIRQSDYYYASAIGMKTGFTTPAGYCLVAAAKNDDLTYISVVLGAGQSESGALGNFTETIKLLDYAADNFSIQKLVESNDPITEVPIRLSSERDTIMLTPEGDLSALLPNDFDKTLVDIVPKVDEDIKAPVTKGQVLGSATFTYNGREYGTLDLVASDDVGRSQVLFVVDSITSFFGSTAFRIAVGAVLGLIAIFAAWLCIMRSRNRRRRRYQRQRGGRYKR